MDDLASHKPELIFTTVVEKQHACTKNIYNWKKTWIF